MAIPYTKTLKIGERKICVTKIKNSILVTLNSRHHSSGDVKQASLELQGAQGWRHSL